MSKIFEDIDDKKIERLADIVNQKDLDEIKIEYDGMRITVKGRRCPPPPPPSGQLAVPPQIQPDIPPTLNYSDMSSEVTASEEVTGTAITAPIVGTYYSRPRPDSEPFVTVGSEVKKGDVLYILETMKVMNEITSDQDGTVSKILVSDGDSLEYGQTVMILS